MNIAEKTTEELLRICRLGDWHAQHDVLMSDVVTAEMLDLLAEHYSDEKIVVSVADHPKALADTLEKLSYHKNWLVRLGVAENHNSRTETLDRLAEDQDIYVACAVLSNPNISSSVMLRHIDSDDPVKRHKFRVEISSNPACPPEVLERLLGEDSYKLDYHILQNPQVPLKHLEAAALSEDVYQRLPAVRNPSMPLDLLEKLSQDPETEVRVAVAANHATEADTLLRMADDTSQSVKLFVAVHPNCTPEVIHRLLSHGEEKITSAIVNHADVSLDLLLSLYENSTSNTVKRAVARHPLYVKHHQDRYSALIDQLVEMDADEFASVKAAVREKRNTSL